MSIDLLEKYGKTENESIDLLAKYKGEDVPREPLKKSFLGQLASDTGESVKGIVGGIYNPAAQLANLVTPKSYQDKFGSAPIIEEPRTLGGQVAGVASGILPFMGAANLGMQGLNAGVRAGIPGAQALAGNNTAANIARLGGGSAAYGAVMDPEDRMRGALIGGAIGAGTGGIGAGINALRPSNMFRGKLTPEELQANTIAARGTNTALGNVIESPSLQWLNENVVRKIPGSGSERTALKTAQQVSDRGNSMLGKFLGSGNKKTYDVEIQNALKKAAAETQAASNANYSKVDQLADARGLIVDRKNLSKTSYDILEEITKSPELSRKLPKNIKEDLRFYANPKNANSLKLTNIFRGQLGEEASKLSREGSKYQAGIFNRLKNSLTKDIDDSIPRNRQDPLRAEYDAAQNFYRENVVPFEKPEVSKFVRRGGDAQTLIGTFLKTGSSDRSALLESLMRHLPESDKGLVTYGYLSNSLKGGKLNPNTLATKINKLGDRQKEVLFNDIGMQGATQDYSRLVGMNKKPLSAMFNPETGRIAADFFPTLIAGSAGLGMGGLAGMGATLGGSALLGRVASKAMTSEKLRESLVNKMIQQSGPRNNQGDLLRAAIIQSLYNQ